MTTRFAQSEMKRDVNWVNTQFRKLLWVSLMFDSMCISIFLLLNKNGKHKCLKLINVGEKNTCNFPRLYVDLDQIFLNLPPEKPNRASGWEKCDRGYGSGNSAIWTNKRLCSKRDFCAVNPYWVSFWGRIFNAKCYAIRKLTYTHSLNPLFCLNKCFSFYRCIMTLVHNWF